MKANTAFSIMLLIAGLFIVPVYAQWEYEGHTIGYRYGDSDGLAVANVGNGATIIVWNSSQGSNYYDLFAQYVDSAGYARWGEGGMVLYEDEGAHQGNPTVLPDGEGGAFVVWSDGRHYPDDWISLYGQRIDSLGNLLWDPEGRRLTADSMAHFFPRIYDDGYGGFVTVFESYYIQSEIGAQRADGDGNIYWDSTGISLVNAPYDQLIPYTCKASDSVFITCWLDGRDIQNYDYDIYMQKFDLEGNIHWGGISGLPAVHLPADQGYLWDGHDIVADDQGGAVVVWVDNRHHTTGNSVLYADRFSSLGQSLWQVNGMKLGDENIYQALRCQAFTIGDNFMFSWVGGSEGFEVSYLDLSGNFIWSNPVVLDTMTTRNVVLTDSSGIFYYLTHYWENGQLRSKGNKVDTLGNRLWNGLPYVGWYMHHKEIILDGYGGMIVVWKDLGSPAIKISRIYEDGHVGGDTTTSIYSGEEFALPGNIELYQNYPNPFNARTRISLQLGSLDPVEIGLYDLLGRYVQSIFEGVPQDYHLEFDIDLSSDEYSSGIYFMVAEQGGERRVVKSTLLK
jgi:hypothetical protein